MATAAKMGCFTLTWDIKNFSVLLSRYNTQLESPYFKTITSDGSARRTILLYNLDRCIKFAQSKTKENYKYSQVLEGFEVSILSARGEIPLPEKICSVSRKKILGINGESLLHDDTLTICCKIRQAKMETGEMRIRTVLFKDNFFLNIKNFHYSCLLYNDTLEKENILFDLRVERNKSNIYTHAFQIEAKPKIGGCFSFVDINPSISVHLGRIVDRNSWFSRATRSWKTEIFPSSNSNFQLHMETTYAVHKEVCDKPSSPGYAGEVSATEIITKSSGTLNGDLMHLYRTALHSDATIQTKFRSFPVHKGILSIRSEVFRAMFEKDQMSEGRSGVVNIDDIDGETVDRMLVFLYGESLDDIQWEEAPALKYAADKYAVHPLKQKCANILKAGLTVDNACDALVLADIYTDQDLMTCAVNFILDHKEVISSPDWEKLEESNWRLTLKITKEILLKKWVN